MPPILLYDGVCGLCNRLVQFILARDHEAIFRFAALQSTFAARILARHAINATDLDTVYLVLNYERPDESLLARSDAVIFILKRLSPAWRAAAFCLQTHSQLSPRLALQRHRPPPLPIFGRSDACTFPSDSDHIRFLDQQE